VRDEALSSARGPRFDARRLRRIATRTLTRWGFGAARRLFPVATLPPWIQRLVQRRTAKKFGLPLGEPLPPVVFVFDAKAVGRVLADYHTFPVKRLYGQKMRDTFGDFLLGLDFNDAPAGEKSYKDQIALVRAVVGAGGHLTKAARAAVADAIAAQPAGEVNVIAMLETVMSRFLDNYFGIPPIAGDKSLLQLNQQTASYVFNIELLNAGLRDGAIDAGGRIRAHLTTLFERKQQQQTPHTGSSFVDHMVALTAPDASADAPATRETAPKPTWTAAQLATVTGGTISGLLVPTTAQFVAVVDRLLDLSTSEYDRLCATAQVRADAIARDSEDEDDGRLKRYVLEAARFNPFPTALQRFCDTDATAEQRTIETGSGRCKEVPAGATVLAMVGAANCDPRLAKHPGAFALARPDTEYMLFGSGQHHCVGATKHWPVAQTLMVEMATALFSRPEVRRKPGAEGVLHTPKGAQWPDRLLVTYTPGGAR
jgi:cytochrome P450